MPRSLILISFNYFRNDIEKQGEEEELEQEEPCSADMCYDRVNESRY